MKTSAELNWLIFRTVMLLVLGLSCWYLGRRLTQAPVGDPRTLRIAVWSGMAVFLGIQFLAPLFIFRRGGVDALSPLTLGVTWTAFTLLGFFATFALTLFFLDGGTTLLALLARGAKAAFGAEPTDLLASPERRQFLYSAMPLAVFGGAGISSALGFWQARTPAKVREIEVPVKDLHPSLDGLRIAQISDLHVGQTIDRAYCAAVVEATLAAKPDLICLTGDLVDGETDVLRDWTSPLRELQAPLGVFYTTGNHEYYWGADAWMKEFEGMGFHVLANAHRVIDHGGAKLLVSGTVDHQAERMSTMKASIEDAIAGSPESFDFHVFLSHHPKGLYDADRVFEQKRIDLQLSGHTHSGQFFPINLIQPLIYPYYKGLNRHRERMWVYVCSGTGYWGPPNRFGVPSEIALLKLVRA